MLILIAMAEGKKPSPLLKAKTMLNNVGNGLPLPRMENKRMECHRSIWRVVLEENLESRDDKIGIGKIEEMEIEKWAEN